MTNRADWPMDLDEGWTELGGDFLVRRTVRYESEEPAGFIFAHRHENGIWCIGSLARKGQGDGQAEWDVLSEHPLTLSPSILRKACGLHGFIQNGKWVSA
jgi:hypothetical protein